MNLQAELSYLQAHLATLELPSPPPPPPPPTGIPIPVQFSMADLPSSSNLPSTLDLSALFDPMVQPSWALQEQQQQPQQRQVELRQQQQQIAESSRGGGGDLQALARELLDRQRTTAPSSTADSTAPVSK